MKVKLANIRDRRGILVVPIAAPLLIATAVIGRMLMRAAPSQTRRANIGGGTST